jgi:AraC-like DNA-binding protein
MKIKFTDLRMQLRIEHAKQLLNSGMADLNKLEAVGLESGFASRSNFHIAFKALTGLTPTE